MLKPEYTGKFKKDFKLAVKRGLDTKLLEDVITLLISEKPLPEKYHDHPLTNSKDYIDVRECHIEPNWLLIYKIIKDRLILRLIRTGSHSDLFR